MPLFFFSLQKTRLSERFSVYEYKGKYHCKKADDFAEIVGVIGRPLLFTAF